MSVLTSIALLSKPKPTDDLLIKDNPQNEHTFHFEFHVKLLGNCHLDVFIVFLRNICELGR
jgi:hypothetical protein